jgi:hypothetical protein
MVDEKLGADIEKDVQDAAAAKKIDEDVSSLNKETVDPGTAPAENEAENDAGNAEQKTKKKEDPPGILAADIPDTAEPRSKNAPASASDPTSTHTSS